MIQVIGTKKSKTTQKALRFFQERGIKVHFLDLSVRPLAEGELDNCAKMLGGYDNLLDKTGQQWLQRGMAHLEFDPKDEILADNGLMLIPITRQGKTACLGLDEAQWQAMVNLEK